MGFLDGSARVVTDDADHTEAGWGGKAVLDRLRASKRQTLL
jgi:hypothetical protein